MYSSPFRPGWFSGGQSGAHNLPTLPGLSYIQQEQGTYPPSPQWYVNKSHVKNLDFYPYLAVTRQCPLPSLAWYQGMPAKIDNLNEIQSLLT
jgi:hypothetical protein